MKGSTDVPFASTRQQIDNKEVVAVVVEGTAVVRVATAEATAAAMVEVLEATVQDMEVRWRKFRFSEEPDESRMANLMQAGALEAMVELEVSHQHKYLQLVFITHTCCSKDNGATNKAKAKVRPTKRSMRSKAVVPTRVDKVVSNTALVSRTLDINSQAASTISHTGSLRTPTDPKATGSLLGVVEVDEGVDKTMAVVATTREVRVAMVVDIDEAT